MPAKKKIEMLEKVSTSLDGSKGMFVIDPAGLSVKETQELRRSLRAAGAEMKVYKNNLVKIALEKAGMPAIDDMLKSVEHLVVRGEGQNSDINLRQAEMCAQCGAVSVQDFSITATGLRHQIAADLADLRPPDRTGA